MNNNLIGDRKRVDLGEVAALVAFVDLAACVMWIESLIEIIVKVCP